MSAQEPLVPAGDELREASKETPKTISEETAIPEEAACQAGEDVPEESPEEQSARKKRIRRLVRLLAVFLVLDMLAAAALLHAMQRGREETQLVRDTQAQKIDANQDMTETQRQERIAELLGQAHGCVSLRSEMLVTDGVAQIYLSNELDSPCAVEVELLLIDSRETILRTGVIEPGWYLKTSTLSKRLAPGEYQCLARCLFYTTDDNAYLGTTARHVLLTVQ